MVATYELPTVSPSEDFSEYIPLLLGVIEDVLDNPYVWNDDEQDLALSRMGALKDYLMGFPEMLIQPGTIIDYGGAVAPPGYLPCDGAAVSRTEYAALFAAIGTNYGVGDGESTFNLPEFRGRVVVGMGDGSGLTERDLGELFGVETVTLDLTQIPAHSHAIDTSIILAKANGTAGTSNRLLRGTDANTNSNVLNQLTGTTVSQGGGGSHTNVPPSGVAYKLIKV